VAPPDEALPLRHGVLKALADDAGTLEAMKASDANGTHVADLSVATEPGTTLATRGRLPLASPEGRFYAPALRLR
jgi:hypothetical protein